MTDYYVQINGFTSYGPYKLEDAREVAAQWVHDTSGEEDVEIHAHVESPYTADGPYESDEMPPEPEGHVHTPWREDEWRDLTY